MQTPRYAGRRKGDLGEANGAAEARDGSGVVSSSGGCLKGKLNEGDDRQAGMVLIGSGAKKVMPLASDLSPAQISQHPQRHSLQTLPVVVG